GVYGGVKEAILTEVDGIILANAGVDRKNVGSGLVALPFTELKGIAESFYRYAYERYSVKIGVIISDSMVTPLRKGTKAVAVYTYGFNPVRDYRGEPDLYGRKIRFTQQALADSIASAAHLVIGEGSEGVPAALVKGVKIEFIEDDTSEMAKVSRYECIYGRLYKPC
ncbi:MAG: coenzyme F420-0:L-glutamate ligase, partial [Thermoprotei archaeon]